MYNIFFILRGRRNSLEESIKMDYEHSVCVCVLNHFFLWKVKSDRFLGTAVADSCEQSSGGHLWTEKWRTLVNREVADSFEQRSGGNFWTEQWRTFLNRAVADTFKQGSGGLFWTEQWRTLVNRAVVDTFEQSSGGLFWTEKWRTLLDTVVKFWIIHGDELLDAKSQCQRLWLQRSLSISVGFFELCFTIDRKKLACWESWISIHYIFQWFLNWSNVTNITWVGGINPTPETSSAIFLLHLAQCVVNILSYITSAVLEWIVT
jgi:hypothetical protein